MPKYPLPTAYSQITPYIYIRGAVKALEFYERVFGAVVKEKMIMPDGRLGHGEIQIGNAVVMLADEFPEMNIISPDSLNGSVTGGLLLYVEDVDAAYAKAIEAGCKEERALQDQFYGDRSGTVRDPFGHRWMIASHIEDVAPDEMKRRMAAMFNKKEG